MPLGVEFQYIREKTVNAIKQAVDLASNIEIKIRYKGEAIQQNQQMSLQAQEMQQQSQIQLAQQQELLRVQSSSSSQQQQQQQQNTETLFNFDNRVGSDVKKANGLKSSDIVLVAQNDESANFFVVTAIGTFILALLIFMCFFRKRKRSTKFTPEQKYELSKQFIGLMQHKPYTQKTSLAKENIDAYLSIYSTFQKSKKERLSNHKFLVAFCQANVAEALGTNYIPPFHYKTNERMKVFDITQSAFCAIKSIGFERIFGYELSRERIRKKIANIVTGRYSDFSPFSEIPHSFVATWSSSKVTTTAKASPIRFVENKKWEAVEDGKMIGTAHRICTDSDFSNYLMTAYCVHVGDVCYVRTGHFGTELKFAQWKAMLEKAFFNEKCTSTKKRCLSLSLCSTSDIRKDEKQAILNTFDLVANEKEIEIAHLNYQCGVYKIFGIAVGENINVKNEKGLMLLVKWFSENLSEICSKWNQTIINISVDLSAAVNSEHASLKAQQMLLGKFDDFCCTVPLTESNDDKQEIERLLYFGRFLNLLIKSHLNIKKQERQNEFLYLSSLFTLLKNDFGRSINCKSGCDRTAIISSLINAIVMLKQSHGNIIYDALLEFNRYNSIKDRYLNKNREEYHLIEEFKTCFLFNMIQISSPIIIMSTGVPGFKYGTRNSPFANPNVSFYLPESVTLFRSSENDERSSDEIVSSSKQIETVISGNDLLWKYLVGLSPYRGGK